LPYRPSTVITTTTKIRPFIICINIAVQTGGVLYINYESYDVNPGLINFYYSTKTCTYYSMALSVVIFDPSTPGLLFLDGTIEQTSLSSTTTTQVDPTYG
jgi:hypothetical protein